MGRKHPTVVTFLEMNAHSSKHVPRPAEPLAVMRSHPPTVHFYRYLYDAVGRDYHWVERKKLSDTVLAEIIERDDNELYVLYANGTPAGFGELDCRETGVSDLSFFGLMPEFTGRGLGPYFLDQVISTAWSRPITKLTVNTCTLDHPSALSLYQRFGFAAVSRAEAIIEEPD